VVVCVIHTATLRRSRPYFKIEFTKCSRSAIGREWLFMVSGL